MRKQLLTCIAAGLYYSGLVSLFRWWAQQAGQRLIILNYHRATGGNLRHHLLYLKRHYRILHLDEALEELYRLPNGEKPLRDRRTPLVLTFDDGYRDNFTHGLALARELQIPFTIFLIPGYVESGDYFWWRERKRLVDRAQVNEATIDGRTYHLDEQEQRRALTQVIDTSMRYASSVTERETFLTSFRKILAVPPSVVPEEEAMLPLKWTQVCEMAESGWISFGAHTMHHPVLAYLTDPAEVRRELEECRTVLEQRLGHPIRTFAYPVGRFQHINKDVLCAVKEAGYHWALTAIYGLNKPTTDPYLLRRIEADVSQHWLVMAAEAAGLWGIISRIRCIPAIQQYLMYS